MALTTQQKTVLSVGMLGAVVGAALGYTTAPGARFREDDALRYGLLLGAVGAVGTALLTSATANASPAAVNSTTGVQLTDLAAASLV